MRRIYEAFEKGALKEAYRIQIQTQILNRFFEYEPGYVAPCKEALTLLGYPCGHTRAPLPPLKTEEKQKLKKAMKSLGLY